jgi:hypothetical protein
MLGQWIHKKGVGVYSFRYMVLWVQVPITGHGSLAYSIRGGWHPIAVCSRLLFQSSICVNGQYIFPPEAVLLIYNGTTQWQDIKSLYAAEFMQALEET